MWHTQLPISKQGEKMESLEIHSSFLKQRHCKTSYWLLPFENKNTPSKVNYVLKKFGIRKSALKVLPQTLLGKVQMEMA